MKKYYLISYGYHYGNSSSASHNTVVTAKTPIQYIKHRIEEGRKMTPDENEFHITFAMEITEEEYMDFVKSI